MSSDITRWMAERVALLMRGGVEVDDPTLESGVAERHTDDTVSFDVCLKSDPSQFVTVTVTPGRNER